MYEYIHTECIYNTYVNQYQFITARRVKFGTHIDISNAVVKSRGLGISFAILTKISWKTYEYTVIGL